MEILANLNLPPTPASEKANAAYNAFTVAQAKGHNPHHAMINALTEAQRSGNKNLTKKRTAQAGLFAKNRKGGSMSESKNMAQMKSLANILDAPHVELTNLFAPPPSEDEVDEIEDIVIGCGYPEGAQGHNVARVAAIRAGLPVTVAAATVNRFCSSGLQSIAMAAHQIQSGAIRTKKSATP